jgi:hypothetical protein
MLQHFLLGDVAVMVNRPFRAPQKPADPSKTRDRRSLHDVAHTVKVYHAAVERTAEKS